MSPKILIVAETQAESNALHEAVELEASAVWSMSYLPQAIKVFAEKRPDVLILSFSSACAAEHFVIRLGRECELFLAISAQILLLCDDDQFMPAVAFYANGPFDACLVGRPLSRAIELKSAVDQAFERRLSIFSKRKISRIRLPLSDKKLILVIEDDHVYSELLQCVLRANGFQVMAAGDGVQALSILRNFTPSLILLDIVMPSIDGISVLMQIKNCDLLSTIPVIVHTGMTVPEVFDDTNKYNASGMLHKPIDQATLLRKINACLLAENL
ncbi:response regulator [Glaciimonas sp. PAMC28666]|uniref:response regulator n=1 Tax=Glaciimonas sp. PAMC28666 TaxID=2807626 RepID=UPI001964EC6A|nr:response regulator [Glaciimonas sp. PAMC28666]QRX82851.1 response regulator [Glaciimonas sp. PAMC28666]